MKAQSNLFTWLARFGMIFLFVVAASVVFTALNQLIVVIRGIN